MNFSQSKPSRPSLYGDLSSEGAALEPGVAVLERGVLDRRALPLGILDRAALRQLGMRLHDVVALEERLLRHLPVGVQDRQLPPLHPHVPDADPSRRPNAVSTTPAVAA
jgi:hypothetical protein